LDDFIFAGRKETQDCSVLMSQFVEVTNDMCIPLAEEKTIGPTTRLKYLGFIIDTVDMSILVPHDKVDSLRQVIANFLTRQRVTLKELQSFVGSLNFFCKAIRSGRAFIRRFYDAMLGPYKPHHHIRLTAAIKSDLQLWFTFLEKFNGVTFFPEESWLDSDVLQFYTDSAGSNSLGCGAYFQGRWFFLPWPKWWENQEIMKDMTFLELIPVVIAVEIWGHLLEKKKVVFHIDNLALVSIINKQTSKSKRTMELVRRLVLKLMLNNVVFKAKHIASVDNDIADSISRKQWQRFRELAPTAKSIPEIPPRDLINMIYNLK
jgi:hypothetical protein